jgi:DHA2 family multidrug resistance protein-like MFS transporter
MTDTSATAASGTKAGRREWLGLVVLALPTLLLSLDFSVTYLAIPRLSADLGATSVQQLWIADIYGFMVAGFLITMGTLGDRIGRRKLLLIGAALFGLASILAAFSVSAEMLIASRAIMGVSGATLMPSTLALISNMFRNPKQMATAIAAWMSCFMGGLALGPVIGGLLLNHFWWGSVFLLGVPVMLLLLVAGPILLPEFRDPNAGRLDLVSVALSLVTILPIVYGFKELAKGGDTLLPVLSLVVGAVLAVVFVVRQRKLANPLMDLALFGNRTFSAALVVSLFGSMLQAGTFFLIVQDVQSVEGLSPLDSGLFLAPATLVLITAIMVGTGLANRIRPAYLFTVGLLIAAIGYGIISQVDGPGQLGLLWIGYAVMALGVGLPSGLGTGLIIGAAPPEKAGSASSISEAGGEFGTSMGVAVFGSISTLVYRNELSGTAPAGLPPGTAAAATDNIAAAVPVSQQLPPALGEPLLDAARRAFTSGLSTVAIISGLIFVALAGLCLVALRHIPPTGSAGETEEAETAQTDEVEENPAPR